jgi:SAM-dependent methyltransferase
MTRSNFDMRRPLYPPAGLPRELKATPVFDQKHIALLALPEVQALIETDETPIPAAGDREGYYGERHIEYWLSGCLDWSKVQPLLEPAGGRYLDLGGASGRVVRHAARTPGVESWLTDININLVDWVDQHFACPVNTYQSRIMPVVPLEDASFSVISAFSVFTHLDTDEVQWLLELRRVLKPGGCLYLTVNDENVWALLEKPQWAWLRANVTRGNREEEFATAVKHPLVPTRSVWEYSTAAGYNMNTFLHSHYIKRKWGSLMDIVDYRVADHGYQSVVILRKR